MAEETNDLPSAEEFERFLRESELQRSLVVKSEAAEAYGLRSEGAFGALTTVCIERAADGRITMTAMSRGAWSPARRICMALTTADWGRLQAALNRADFWALPEQHNRFGLDGWDWTIEGRQGARYHASTCWVPDTGTYFDLGRLFLELAGFEPNEP